MSIWNWSHTPGDNANADATINWQEGMPPSQVNDSARAMMARVADWRDDFSGKTISAGSASAYTLTTFQGIASVPQDGQLVAMTAHTGNLTGATLQVDGGTVYPIWLATSLAIAQGVMAQGTPYQFKWSAANSAWMLVGYQGQPSIVPIGAILDYAGSSAPNSNYALCFGQAISRSTYSTLFAIIGTTYGAGNGTTTFNIPDLRGRTVSGYDNMGGVTAGRISVAGGNFDGTVLGAAGGSQNHTITQAELPAVSIGATGGYTPAGSVNFTPTGSVSKPTITVNNGASQVLFGPSGTTVGAGGLQIQSSTITASLDSNPIFTGDAMSVSLSGTPATISVNTAALGSGNAMSVLSPTVVMSKVIRLL